MAAYTAIDDPEAYFQVKTYSGDGGSSQSITLDGDTDLQTDFIWIRGRSNVSDHYLSNSVVGSQKQLKTNETDAEATRTDGVSSFDSDGFTFGANNATGASSRTYVAWCWKESATAGFDIVTYTGTDETSHTVAHNLGTIPHIMWVKSRDRTEGWTNYHHQNTDAPETDRLMFNTTAATGDYIELWYDTAPTSSVFTIGTDFQVDKLNDDYVAYLFSEKQGFSKFGRYEGNGATDGPFIYTGFRPAWVMIKATDSTSNWNTFDNKRSPFNPVDDYLKANANAAEDTGSDDILMDFCANGFKVRGDNDEISGSETYVYMAWAEAPFVNSEGAPGNAR